MMRQGSAGSNTGADHIAICDEAIAALPPAYRRRLMVTCDGAGASHGLIEHLDARSGRRRRLRIAASWPWASDIATAWTRIAALAQAP
jgi:hypothetical protein